MDWSNAGATSATGAANTAVGLATDWSFTSGDFEVVGDLLRLPAPVTFVAPSTVTSGSPGTGRTMLNGARLSAGSIASGVITLTTDATSTLYNNSTKTALKLDRDYGLTNCDTCRFFLVQRLTLTAGSTSQEGIHATADEGGTSANYARVGVVSDGAGGYSCSMRTRLSSSSAAISQSTIWTANEVHGQRGAVWYSNSDSATRPPSNATGATAWTRGLSDATLYGTSVNIDFSQVVVGKGNNVTGKCSYMGLFMVPQHQAPDETVFPINDGHLVYFWTADEFDQDEPVATIDITVSSDKTISDAALQAALVAAVQQGNYDPSVWTFRARRGVEPTGSYATADSVTLETASGENLYIHAKCTSAGTNGGALGDISITL